MDIPKAKIEEEIAQIEMNIARIQQRRIEVQEALRITEEEFLRLQGEQRALYRLLKEKKNEGGKTS